VTVELRLDGLDVVMLTPRHVFANSIMSLRILNCVCFFLIEFAELFFNNNRPSGGY
jgi:hypothetical protein